MRVMDARIREPTRVSSVALTVPGTGSMTSMVSGTSSSRSPSIRSGSPAAFTTFSVKAPEK